jgi:hypothetical protein
VPYAVAADGIQLIAVMCWTHTFQSVDNIVVVRAPAVAAVPHGNLRLHEYCSEHQFHQAVIITEQLLFCYCQQTQTMC